MKKLCLVVVLAIIGFVSAHTATAQVELIIRPSETSALEFAQAVAQFPAKSASLDPALFDAVQSARPVYAFATPSGKAAAQVPYAFTLSVADSSTYEVVKERWERRGDIESVEPNATFSLTTSSAARTTALPPRSPNDPLADSLDHLQVIRAPDAWSVTTGEASVRIGLIDTGLDLDHPDLASQLWVNPGEDVNGNGRIDPSDRNGIDDDDNGWVDDLIGYDFVDRPDIVDVGDFQERDPDPAADIAGPASGHATAVAGAMSAAQDNGTGITGVAPGARLVPLRAFGGDGRGATDDIAAAILYAAQMGFDVVNLSFGRDFASPLIEDAIRYAIGRGTVVVASAGNNGGDAPHYPSDYPEVVSVAWFNADGTDIAFRGEFGVGIDLGAPGTAIYTTLKPDEAEAPSPETLYGRQSGSSMAAPLVAGAVGLLRSVDPALSPGSIQSILTASAVDVGAPGWDHRTAAGRLDMADALARALPARTAISAPSHLSGTDAASLPIVGTAIDPSFASYSVYYARGDDDLDARTDPWVRLAGPEPRQVIDDTLATVPAGTLAEGPYTVRLVTTLRSGTTVEDRRRIYIDRTPPRVQPLILQDGLVGGHHGVVADVASDDLTTASLHVTLHGRTETVRSDVRNARHGLAWPDTRGAGGVADVQVVLTNASGLSASYDTTLTLPQRQVNTALFDEMKLDVPHGALLPMATDFDDDGLHEITFNQYERGALGDTLRTVEWDGTGLVPFDALVANVIPRDTGDTNADGQQELLTQVGGATLLLEQPLTGGFPTLERFVDTTGLQNPGAEDALWGARLTDLDRDGRGEILGHNRSAWRVLEWNGSQYVEAARLPNPTGQDDADPAVSPNGFQQPEALVADFDADGRPNVLVGDNDGDWIVYEADGDDTYRVAWTHETTRIDAGARFARGDFDGDGDIDFVTYTQNLPILTDTGAREPPIGLYYFWETQGDDTYVLRRTLPVEGNSSSNGSIAAADFDTDGRDEVAVVHPPHLYLLEHDAQGDWQLAYHRGGSPGLRSPALVAADITGDARPDLVAGTADETLHLWQFRSGAAARPPPQWVAAHAQSSTSVFLRWRAPQADSVTVWAGAPNEALNPLGASVDSSTTVEASAEQRYALWAWYGGEPSPLSSPRLVRPHAPAVVQSVAYPSARSVALRFTQPINSPVAPDQFRLDAGPSPTALLQQEGGRLVTLRFDPAPDPRDDILRWHGLRDVEGTPVQQAEVPVAFPAPSGDALIVEDWTLQDERSVALTFNAPLSAAEAQDRTNYRLAPRGRVTRVQFDASQPHRVVVEVEGAVFGAVGEPITLRLSGVRSASGALLGDAGGAIRLVEPASDLAGVYVYPNPHYGPRHAPFVTVAGLPVEATVHILSPHGTILRTLSETGRDGGLRWDLQDRTGRPVPSGVYLIQVESPDQESVLRKAAIIR